MSSLKRCAVFLLTTVMILSALPGMALRASAEEIDLAEPYSLSSGELIARIEDTYDDAKALAGRRGFNGKCSTLVNCSTLALGIQSVRFDGDGRDEYDLYDNVRCTDGGYDVIHYPASEYGLEAALNAISENGTRDVYNIIVGFESGRTASSRAYGHTCFVHGIVDGMVYYSESYGLYLNNTYYPEGEPIVCSIADFANYYNIWAIFEGAIHFDFPDETPPAMTEMQLVTASEAGFTLRFRAEDNMEITDIYAKVWTYGGSEEDAVTVPVTMTNHAASIRVNTEDFGGFTGWYYVSCYASDRRGNVSVAAMAQDGVCLYEADSTEGTYRVKRNNTGIHNAPYIRVNDTNTRESVVNMGVEVSVAGSYVNDEGETWYLLADGGWVRAENLREIGTEWSEFWETLHSFFASSKLVSLSKTR